MNSARRAVGVQSLERAMGLIERIVDLDGDASIRDLAAMSGLPTTTVHRLLTTLMAGGFVVRRPARRYGLGPRLIPLGALASQGLVTWVEPYLRRLMDEAGETANLAVLDDDAAVYIAQVPSRHNMRMFTQVGRRVDLHCTGVGKALLAQMPQDQALALAHRSGLPELTPRTFTSIDALRDELDRIRIDGYAIDDGEQEVGVRCLAVAVPTASARMAVSVSGPQERMTRERERSMVSALRATASALAAELDPRGPWVPTPTRPRVSS